MGYHIPTLKVYVRKYNANVFVIHWDHKKLTPYQLPEIEGVEFYSKSDYTRKQLFDLIFNISPDVIRVSGWMDSDYLYVCKRFNKLGVKIIAGSDTQLKGTIRQFIGIKYFKLKLLKYFDKIWISGPYQYEYAKKLGFKNAEIGFNNYSADVEGFRLSYNDKRKIPKKLLFLGRLHLVKGVKELFKAWSAIDDKKGWDLTLIGEGPLKERLSSINDITVKEFLQPKELVNEIRNYGALVLPSLREPWAVVIHEAMAAGLPVIATDVCGAAPVFIIDGYNGYTVKPGNVEDLKNTMDKLMALDNWELMQLSKNAYNRSTIITPEISAANFMALSNKG